MAPEEDSHNRPTWNTIRHGRVLHSDGWVHRWLCMASAISCMSSEMVRTSSSCTDFINQRHTHHTTTTPCRSFQVSCAPLSPFERRLAASPTGLTAAEGWFRVCAAGGANSRQLAAATAAAAAAAAAAAGAGSSSALALVPAGSEPGTPVAAGGSSSGSGAAAAGAAGCSEYCARLAESMYIVCDLALALLVATAPAVDPAEVAAGQGLGSMWPSVRALAAVLVSFLG